MAKKVDDNGYLTYEDVLISREGVFDYAGFQIDPEGKSLEPKKIYKVYRPKSEVCKKQFVESLENKPLVDDHTMLGAYGKPAEKKGVHGVLTDVKAVGNELHGTITVWSESMKEKIRCGKRELSLGYTGYFRPQSGRFEGQNYDFVQFGLSANHIALVDDARMGHACKVTDSAVVICDSLELPMPDDQKKSCGDELIEKLKGCSDEEIAKVKDYLAGLEEKKPGEDAEPKDAPAEEPKCEDKCEDKAEEVKPEDKSEEPKVEDKAEEKQEEKPAEDAKPEEEPKPAEDEKTEEKPEDKAEKPVEDKKAVQDAAIAEYRKAEALAKRCEPLFGAIVMDGLYTEKDVAVKVCAMDSALKFVDADKALDALTVRLGEHEKKSDRKVTVADSSVRVTVFDFQSAFQSRK